MTALCTAITCDITNVAACKVALIASGTAWASGDFVVSGVSGNRLYVYKIRP